MSSSGASSSDTASGDEDQDSLRDVRNVDNAPRQSASANEVNSFSIESIRQYLAQKLDLHTVYTHQNSYVENRVQVLETLDIEGLIKHWKANGFKNIITMVGAGISTSAGIPDFRSPETGLYNNLQKYNLPHPTAIFELEYFRFNPKPFFVLAKDLYPGTFKPTPCHYFIKMLNDKGLLLRHYTQNIDTLERIAGLPDDKIVEAHGTFYTNHCMFCHREYSMEWVKDKIFSDEIPTCECGGIIKPDIVFFGENLSEKFYDLHPDDFDNCDLLIIMGTSLGVQPFASLIDRVGSKCVRLLINREKVGNKNDVVRNFLYGGGGLYLDSPDNWRDISLIGNCDEGVHEIANLLGFGDELIERINVGHNEIEVNQHIQQTAASGSNLAQISSHHINDKSTEDNNDDVSPLLITPES